MHSGAVSHSCNALARDRHYQPSQFFSLNFALLLNLFTLTAQPQFSEFRFRSLRRGRLSIVLEPTLPYISLSGSGEVHLIGNLR